MGKNIVIFLVCFVVAFGGGYLFFRDGNTEDTTKNVAQTDNKEDKEVKDDATSLQQGDASDNEGRVLVQTGCISCHSVSALNLQGGATGPDLSQSYVNVEGKHGKPLDEFLKNPTSAVMSGVISGDPLTEDELKGIVEALKVASEK